MNMLDRRFFLAGAAAGVALLAMPGMALARAATDRRFVFIIQRGAADGLATLAPVGDPVFQSLRASFLEDAAAGTKIDPFFSLHPALAETATIDQAREALFVHAIAPPY